MQEQTKDMTECLVYCCKAYFLLGLMQKAPCHLSYKKNEVMALNVPVYVKEELEKGQSGETPIHVHMYTKTRKM